MPSCIYCGSDKDIVAQLTLTIGDEKAVVDVCEVHAEDATIRTAKEKYLERKSEIDDLLQRAKSLGLILTQERTPSGLIVVRDANKDRSAVNSVIRQQPQQQLAEDDADMIDAEVIERRERTIVSSGGVVGQQRIEGNSSLDMKDIREMLGDEVLQGKVRMEMIEKQSGGVVAIPTKKVNGLGTTRINVVQITDQDLQRRFKNIAEQSKSDNGWNQMRHLGKDGIHITNCPICRGDGTTRNAGKEMVCPKCHGRGIIN